MGSHLPILQVALPMIGAPLCLLVRHPLLARLIAVAIAWASLAVAAGLLGQVMATGPISYELGGFAPPHGIELRIDTANAYVLVLVSAIASVVFAFGPGYQGTSIPHGRQALFYAMLLLCFSGLLGMTVTGDAFNIFVFLEISSLASYTLIALGTGRRAAMAAFSYLIMGTIGGTFYLLGVGLLYQMTGTLNIADMATRLVDVQGSRTVYLAFGLVMVGIGIKLAVFPLHQWLPNAYAHAPSLVSAFLAATATKVMYYVLVRLIFTLFGAAFVFDVAKAHYLLIPMSLAAMFIGALAAIFQTDLKRMLAYSSVAQLGYMTLGLSLNSLMGLTAGLVHLFNHALMKGGLFLVVGCIVYRTHSASISDMRGLGRSMPFTMAAFLIASLSIIGLPPFGGLWSKWYLALGTLDAGQYALLAVLLISALLNIAYLIPIPLRAFFYPPEDMPGGGMPGGGMPGGGMKEAPLLSVIALCLTALGCFVLFLYPEPLYRLAAMLVNF